jgi:hypothetical protein
LAIELLYRPETFSLATGASGSPRLVRAELIRELTIYVSCLSWMPGRDANSSDFSKEVQQRLTKIIDQIVEAPPITSSPADPIAEFRDPRIGGGRAADFPDPAAPNFNHLFFDWDTTMYLDSQLDLFSQALM